MSGHTGGEWHVVDGGPHWNNPEITNYHIRAARGDRVFDVAWSDAGELVAEHVYEKDDALLMAASKELLGVARKSAQALLSAGVVSNAYSDNPLEGLLHETLAAIAKATGGDQ